MSAPDGGPTGDGAADGGARAACDGLTPPASVPEPVDRIFDTGPRSFCRVATADRGGQVALGFFRVEGKGNDDFDLYGPAGESSSETVLAEIPLVNGVPGGLHAVPGGWHSLVRDPGEPLNLGPPLNFRAFDTAGHVVADDEAHVSFALALLPEGSAVLSQLWTPGDAGFSAATGPLLLERLDAAGRRIWSTPLDRGPPSRGGSMVEGATSGHLLVLLPTTSTGADGWQARWFDAAGLTLTVWFDVSLPAGAVGLDPVLVPLLDGGLALGSDATWRFALRDDIARADPAPGWLADRPATRLALVRGGSAYAVIRSETTLEIVAPTGESCGLATFPSGSAGHPADRIDVGADGTVLQRYEDTTGTRGSGSVHCGWRWWSGLLR